MASSFFDKSPAGDDGQHPDGPDGSAAVLQAYFDALALFDGEGSALLPEPAVREQSERWFDTAIGTNAIYIWACLHMYGFEN